VEEADRGNRKETPADPNGWNSRIGFPHEKTEPEEKVADDSAIYNPMNRDLRTVVETAAEKAAKKAVVGVAAVAPEGLPKDVTPEEVAAITAAAAQIQVAAAAVKDETPVGESRSFEPQISEAPVTETQVPRAQVSEKQLSETLPSETHVSEITSHENLAAPADRVEDNVVSPVCEEAKTEAAQENRIDGGVDEAAAGETHVNGDVKAEETQDLPVTMAAATSESAAAVSVDGSQWTAVPVALEGEDATISLELEMQKAYAAFAPYVAAEAEAAGVATAQTVEVATAENAPLPEIAPAVEAAPAENIYPPEAATVVADAAPAPVAELESSEAPVASSAPVVEAEVSQPENKHPWPEAEPAIAEAAAASGDTVAAVVESHETDIHEPGAQPPDEYKPDSETAKSAAAAWASWRQIRDTRKDGEVSQGGSREFEVAEAVPAETAAMAVAAGAEQIVQEVSAAPKGDPADVASIVESVLANLRPKLMEEISRKMAEKK
jgi:hypothetical protein